MTGPFSLEVTISITSMLKSALAVIAPGAPAEKAVNELERERRELTAEAAELNRRLLAEESLILQAVATRDPDKIAQAEDELSSGSNKATARLKVIAVLLEDNKAQRDVLIKEARDKRWGETKAELTEALINLNALYTQAAESSETFKAAFRRAGANGFTPELNRVMPRLPIISPELAKRFHHDVEVFAGKKIGTYGATWAATTGRSAADYMAEQARIAEHNRGKITFPTDANGRRISDANLPTALQKQEAARPTMKAGERPAPNYVLVRYIKAGCPIHTIDGMARSKPGDEVWVIREIGLSHVAQTIAAFVDEADLAEAVTGKTEVPQAGPSPAPRAARSPRANFGKPREVEAPDAAPEAEATA